MTQDEDHADSTRDAFASLSVWASALNHHFESITAACVKLTSDLITLASNGNYDEYVCVFFDSDDDDTT